MGLLGLLGSTRGNDGQYRQPIGSSEVDVEPRRVIAEQLGEAEVTPLWWQVQRLAR